MDAGALDVLEDPRESARPRRRRRRRPRLRAREDTCRPAAALRARIGGADSAYARAALRCRRSPSPGRPARTTDAPRTGKPSSRAMARASRKLRAALSLRTRDAQARERGVELFAILRHVQGLAVAADDRHAAAGQLAGEIDRGLPAEGEHHAARVGRAICRLDLVGARRLEDERVGDVEVGRDRLRIVIDDDRRAARGPQRPGRVHAAVIELDALSDANRSASHHDDRLDGRRAHLVLLAARKIVVGRLCRETRRRRCRPCERPEPRRCCARSLPSSSPTQAVSPRRRRRRVRCVRGRRVRRSRRARIDRSPRARRSARSSRRGPRCARAARRRRRAARASAAR